MIPIITHIRRQKHARIVAFGSSNTERADHSEGQYNWFDWLDYGLRVQYGRNHHVINAGVCGDTCAKLLERFDRDVALYQPHVVVVTIGGNDSAPDSGVTVSQFTKQLSTLVTRVQALPKCRCILQTYYSVQHENLDKKHVRRFQKFMQVVRDAASRHQADLIDNLNRWEPIRTKCPSIYAKLMHDPFHVSPLGNMFWGLDVCRYCGVKTAKVLTPWCSDGLWIQTLADRRGKMPAK